MNELKNRGVNDIFIACCDGLKGFPEAIETVFPKTKVQLCIVHQVRNSLKYVSYKQRKEIATDLKTIYGADTLAEAEDNLLAFAEIGDSVACVILEPIAGNMNMIQPSAEFIQTLRRLTEQHGTVLIYDEVMTGFRVALGGAQSLHGITPDLTTMGKVIGGGMPLAAFGGRADIMACISPLGGVYQAGTLSGNPVATACGLATLKEIQRPGFYQNLSATTRSLMQGLQRAADAAGVPFCFDCEGGMFGFFLLPSLPQNYQQVMQTDSARFNRLFHALLDGGVYIAPALYEAGFVSAAHSQADIEQTLAVAEQAFLALA